MRSGVRSQNGNELSISQAPSASLVDAGGQVKISVTVSNMGTAYSEYGAG